MWHRGRFAMLVLGVGVAYHQSLRTLVRGLVLDTPLAYLGLVPLVAAGLAVVLARRPDRGPPIHDRQLDYIVGLPLLVGALLANLVLPTQLDTKFWLWRLDLLTLPFFVAGAAFLLFGTRATWKLRVPILFLFAAWPYPYTEALFRWTDGFTLLTIRALAWLLRFVPWAVHNPSGDGSKFDIVHQGKAFTLSVASQCSGANSLVGFLLIGSAFVMLMRGPRLGKFAWLLVGASVTWMLNLFRIMLLFGIGQKWGERVAIDAFHPFIGLVLLNLGLILLIVGMPLFRLSRPTRSTAPRTPISGAVAAPAWALARQVFISIAALLGVLNSGIVDYGLIASDMGVPRLASFTARPPTLANWATPQVTNTYEWGRRFFGEDSTWLRFSLPSGPPGSGPLTTTSPIIADVISTSSLGRLETYGVEACYSFHSYDVSDQVDVELGGGVRGTFLSWQAKKGPRYSALFWHWPVVENGKRRFERVTLLLPDSAVTATPGGDTEVADFASTMEAAISRGRPGVDPAGGAVGQHRLFLVQVGRQIVQNQPAENIQI